MIKYAALALVALAACAPAKETAEDGAALATVDTLKPTPAADTLPTKAVTGSPPAKTAAVPAKTATSTPPAKTGSGQTTATGTKKLGRDSAFRPPPNLPQLDTVKRKKPPTSR